MAGTLNKVTIIGNIGNDLELKSLEGDSCVLQISVATTEKYKNKQGQRVEDTEWHRVVLWNRTAQLTNQFCKKGTQIYVEGRLKTRKWTDNGVDRFSTEIVGENVKFLSGLKPKEEKMPF